MKVAFPLLYIPSTCSFRMCDIWRGFIAQRIMWENNWSLSFHSPDVVQVRNQHDLHSDLIQELEGYLYNEEIMQGLRDLKLGAGTINIAHNMQKCYDLMISKGFFEASEAQKLRAWQRDLASMGIA
jgi:hypothetical protein